MPPLYYKDTFSERISSGQKKEEADGAAVNGSRRETENQRAGVTLTASEGDGHIDTEAAPCLFRLLRLV